MKKKAPGFMVAMALKPKGEDKEPEGFDEEEPDGGDEVENDDPDAAMADAGRAFRDAMKGDDDLALANAVASIVDLRNEMNESEK